MKSTYCKSRSWFPQVALTLLCSIFVRAQLPDTNIYRSKCSKNAVMYLVSENKAMLHSSFQTSTVGSDDECLSLCLLEMRCKSINVWNRTSNILICRLFDVDRNTHELKLRYRLGVRYYDAGYLITKNGPKCRNGNYSCGGNMICVDDDCNDSFRCHHHNATSCQQIKHRYQNIKLTSGFYKIHFQKETYQVYCDMETAGGGWQLIGKVEIKVKSDSTNLEVEQLVDLFNTTKKNFIPNRKVMAGLKKAIGFSQLRFYCHKPHNDKRIHIFTPKNSTGDSVVQFFAGKTKKPPLACGSYLAFDDDNSYLSRHCNEWKNSTWTRGGNLYGFPFYIHGKKHYGIHEIRMECDDYVFHDEYKLPGIWKIYVK